MNLLLIGLLLFVLGSYLATALALRFGARWAHVPNITFLRALGTAVALGCVSLIAGAMLQPLGEGPPVAVAAFETGSFLLASWLVVKVLLRTTWKQAIRSWLPALGVSIAVAAFVYLVVKPHIVEAFIMPTSAMAPTLLGPHQRGRCPHCGQTATVSFNLNRSMSDEPDTFGMCGSCQQAGNVTNLAPVVHAGDRFLTNKLLTPRRWDVITYRSLDAPADRYAKRLVGLPGEEVVIKDGSIWINGEKQQPPAEIARLTFGAYPDAWGLPERPLRLGPDEYFVIGDFSLRSSDSRRWGPLPGKNIEGVVSAVYFPPARWRIFR